MKLTPVDQIPKMNGYHKLQELIEEFTNGDAKIVKVEFSETDYKSPAVCRSCLAAAIKRSKRPVKVWRRGNEIFLRGMFDKGSSHRNRRLFSFSDAGIAQPFMEVISMDKIKALNTKVMAKDFGRVGLGTLAIVAGAFLWGKFLYGRGVRGCQRWMCETFPDEYESMTEKVADMLEQDH